MHKLMSHAVKAQRIEPGDSPDDFPTPPWATRALIPLLGSCPEELQCMSVWEPGCGRGHMAMVLEDHFDEVRASDAFDYGYPGAEVLDFLDGPVETNSVDWVITNPPFRLAKEFILRGLSTARVGVAMLARTVLLESVGRYRQIYTPHPPSIVAPFVERVPMLKGRLDRAGTTATSYAWFIWHKGSLGPTQLRLIPPCRKGLERDEDY
jgi:hypothetical protein